MIDQVLTAVASKVTALGLSYASVTLPVVTRKLARRQSTDTLPFILITPDARNPEVRRRFASIDASAPHGYTAYTYSVLVVVLFANTDDQSTAIVGNYATMRDAIEAQFDSQNAGTLGLTGVRRVESVPEAFLPPDLIEQRYDYSAVRVTVEMIKGR